MGALVSNNNIDHVHELDDHIFLSAFRGKCPVLERFLKRPNGR